MSIGGRFLLFVLIGGGGGGVGSGSIGWDAQNLE